MLIIELLKALFLGVVEGVTEWLPVSSTGHLILVQEFMKLNQSKSFVEMFNIIPAITNDNPSKTPPPVIQAKLPIDSLLLLGLLLFIIILIAVITIDANIITDPSGIAKLVITLCKFCVAAVTSCVPNAASVAKTVFDAIII